jgi:zinc transport system permease protein
MIMDTFGELFHYQFFINAFVAAILTSISCGILGTYIVTKRMVFISGGITHASFGGIGMGYYLGLNPVLGAAVFSIFSALGIEFFTRKVKVREDSMIAIFWSSGMALGIIFVYLTPGYAPNLMSYLFGNILTVSFTDIYLLAALTVVLILFFILFYHPVVFIAFDEEFARIRRVPVDLIKYLLMGFIALTIVFTIRVAGVILVMSLLTVPQTTANIFTKSFMKVILLSICIAFAGTFIGLMISYYLNIPSGATIIFTLVVIFAFIRSIKYLMVKRHVKTLTGA